MRGSYEYERRQLPPPPPATGSSRLRSSGGEIVEVHGGHIVRSTGLKDRHSKVCTAKGPRDRRVRLSAHTAIQFYDVQDRLGYDRPSKAVDWLIKKAKSAIDELAELPAWKPTATATATAAGRKSTSILNFERNPYRDDSNHRQINHFMQHPDDQMIDNQMGNHQNSSFLPPSLDSDSIADTIKSFFPMGASSSPAGNHSTAMQFHQSQDLKLSLRSFQDPIFHHHHQSEQSNSMFLDNSGWPENQSGGFQVAWGGGASAGYMFSSPETHPFFGQTTNNQSFHDNSQREPLQSSNTPSIRAWLDRPPLAGAGAGAGAGTGADQQAYLHPSGFTSAGNGFSGFLIPARIQGEQEEHDGISDKPSSASSDSRH